MLAFFVIAAIIVLVGVPVAPGAAVVAQIMRDDARSNDGFWADDE